MIKDTVDTLIDEVIFEDAFPENNESQHQKNMRNKMLRIAQYRCEEEIVKRIKMDKEWLKSVLNVVCDLCLVVNFY